MSTTVSGDTGVNKFDGTTIAGHIIQVVNYTTGAMATGTALIPNDNTVPQITEGFQVMSLAFTAKKANSKLKITVVTNKNASTPNSSICALFKDSISNAIGATHQSDTNSTYPNTNTFIVFIDAVDTSLHSFTVRCGLAVAGTLTFNGSASTAYFGGSLASSITIEEIAQ